MSIEKATTMIVILFYKEKKREIGIPRLREEKKKG